MGVRSTYSENPQLTGLDPAACIRNDVLVILGAIGPPWTLSLQRLRSKVRMMFVTDLVRRNTICTLRVCLLLGGALLPLVESFAASFPSRSIRMIVPVAAGGPTDLLARAMTPKLSEALGQQVIVDNRAGANGNIGMEIAARSSPDGLTWVLATAGHLTVNPVSKWGRVHISENPDLTQRLVGRQFRFRSWRRTCRLTIRRRPTCISSFQKMTNFG
jgi:hypothetical protein